MLAGRSRRRAVPGEGGRWLGFGVLLVPLCQEDQVDAERFDRRGI